MGLVKGETAPIPLLQPQMRKFGAKLTGGKRYTEVWEMIIYEAYVKHITGVEPTKN